MQKMKLSNNNYCIIIQIILNKNKMKIWIILIPIQIIMATIQILIIIILEETITFIKKDHFNNKKDTIIITINNFKVNNSN